MLFQRLCAPGQQDDRIRHPKGGSSRAARICCHDAPLGKLRFVIGLPEQGEVPDPAMGSLPLTSLASLMKGELSWFAGQCRGFQLAALHLSRFENPGLRLAEKACRIEIENRGFRYGRKSPR